MKRARDTTDDTTDTQETPLDGNQRVTPGFLDQPVAATTTADDDDPYGFGNVGAPGFVSKPSGMKSGYVPGYLRVPGSAGGAMIPGLSAVKSARTAMTGPGAKPGSATRGGLVKSQPPAETAQAEPLPATKPDLFSPAQLSPVLAMPEDSETALMLQRRRVQNKDLPEQHRLPEDLPPVIPGKIAKTSATASGPLSAQIKALPKFHEEIKTFVDQSVPNQAEQLTKVFTAVSMYLHFSASASQSVELVLHCCCVSMESMYVLSAVSQDVTQKTGVLPAQALCLLQAAAFERIKPACLAPFPRSQYALVHVQPFGSYANGLSLAASDIDVVITGVTYPDDGRGGMSPQLLRSSCKLWLVSTDVTFSRSVHSLIVLLSFRLMLIAKTLS